MTTPFSFHQEFAFSPQGQGYLDDTQFVGTPFNASQTPRATPRGLSDRTRDATHLQTQMEPGRLRFLQLDEWDEHNSYSEDVPTCLHYSIEWKVAVNNKVVHRDTEQDVVLIPIGYWHTTLRLKLERVLERKFGLDNQMRCDDTNVTVSVTDRTQRDLVKSFENLNIDWPTVAKQLEEWGERLRSGKKLRVDLCFNYVDSHLAAGPGAGPAQRGNKRGASATQRMLNDRAMQLDAEQEATGNPSIWRDVYTLMQCPGS
ncbi:hypothetical protein V8E54_013648, partial [Elaphomyces granulatus]